MEDNRYLEQAAALLDKAKEAGEIMGVVLITSGYKGALKMLGSGTVLINTLMGLPGQDDDFDNMLALTVAAWMTSPTEFSKKVVSLLSIPKELGRLLQEASDTLGAEISEYKARREAPNNDTEKEESHDSEEAA